MHIKKMNIKGYTYYQLFDNNNKFVKHLGKSDNGYKTALEIKEKLLEAG